MAEVLDNGEPLAVHLQLANTSQSPRSGRVIVIADRRYDIGEMTLAGGESRSVHLSVPQADLLSPCATRPLYIAWMSDDGFTAAHTLFHHSTVQLPGDESVAFTPDHFRKLDKFSMECPVGDLSVGFHDQAIDIDFRWNDQTPVPANGAFDAFKLSSRTRVTLKGPIDLESSPTWQPCDSVEFFIDTRSPDSHGRDTSPADGNPEGVLRIGIYYELVNNEPVARLMLPVGLPSRDAKLQALGGDRYRLTVEMATFPDMLGFSARVTDLDSFRAESMRVFTLSPDDDIMQSQYFTPGFTSQLSGYLDFFRLSRDTSGVFYRIGY